MSFGGGGGNSTSTTKQELPEELKPLFAQTANLVMEAQGQPGANLSQFLYPNPQFVPGATAGQQMIAQAQWNRAFNQPALTPWEYWGASQAPTWGTADPVELAALSGARNWGQLYGPEQMALQQANYLTGGPLGEAPATQAAMRAVRTPILNDLAQAGLGNSSAVGLELQGGYAPILAQEMALRAQVIPQLGQIGQQQRAGAISQGNLQAQIGEALRRGDIEGANYLAAIGGTEAQRTSQLLQELGVSEEAIRQIEAQQALAQFQDFLRRQDLSQGLTLGVLGGFPTIGSRSVTSTKTSGGGK